MTKDDDCALIPWLTDEERSSNARSAVPRSLNLPVMIYDTEREFFILHSITTNKDWEFVAKYKSACGLFGHGVVKYLYRRVKMMDLEFEQTEEFKNEQTNY